MEVQEEARAPEDLGRDFGATLTEREVRRLMEREFARTGDDVVRRRSKPGLRMTARQIDALDEWMQAEQQHRKQNQERILG